MKSNYLQLFMDRDLSLELIEDKEREIGELCYHLSMAQYSSLVAVETPSYLEVVTHMGMSGTRDLREEPLVTIPHEENSKLQIFEESFDHASILHCRDHESFLLAQGFSIE
jgi:hypothetical protein